MRTKTLFLAAAALAVGIATSVAQTVYSQNIVGYVNQILPSGYNLIGVPLNATNSGQTVPAVQVLSCLQQGDAIITWDPVGGTYSTYTYYNAGEGQTWLGPDGNFTDVGPNLTLGTGFFYQNSGNTPETNTYAGTVVLSNTVSLVSGYSIGISSAPIGGSLDSTNFNLPLQQGDAIILWDNAGGFYLTYTYYNAGVGQTWLGPDGNFTDTAPTITVGGAMFYQNSGNTPEPWQQNVIVK